MVDIGIIQAHELTLNVAQKTMQVHRDVIRYFMLMGSPPCEPRKSRT